MFKTVLIAILLDAVTAFAYFFQLNNQSRSIFLLGLIVQAGITLFLLIGAFAYRGKKLSLFSPIGYRFFTFRFSIIIISLFVSGVLLFLYGLNYLGINPLIFSAW